MGKPKWRTINAEKLESEVVKISSEIDVLMPRAHRTNDVGLAVRLHSLTATHNAIMAILNSLD